MVEKFGVVKNPLTIIAIFAAIAEINGTVVITQIAQENQHIFVWFLILFPALLVLAFFITLNFNHHVLYAPSDFRDETNYFKGFRPATQIEVESKITNEVAEIATNKSDQENGTESAGLPQDFHNQKTYNTTRSALLIEHLALKYLSTKLNTPIAYRQTANFGQKKYIFDGVIEKGNSITIVEVGYAREAFGITQSIVNRINKFMGAWVVMPDDFREKFSLMIVIITEENPESENIDIAVGRTSSHINNSPFEIDIKIYSTQEIGARNER